MLYPIVLYVVSILGIIFTCLYTTGKIKICRNWTGYVCIAVIPFFIILFPFIFLVSFVDEYTNYFTFIPIGLIGIEIFALLCYVVIKLLIFPKKFLADDDRNDDKRTDINSVRLVVHYSIFAALFYVIPVIGFICLGVLFGLYTVGTLILPTFLIIFAPILASLSGMYFSIAVFLCILVAVLSINAVMRASYLSKGVRKHFIRHVIFMFIPVFNMISLFQISRQCKKDLIVQLNN